DNAFEEKEYIANFTFSDGYISESVENIGFRIKGNTSVSSQKKSFRISFNSFESGRKFYGVEKMNLNGEHNDPSVIRAKLAMDLYREMGVPAPRTNHYLLYINDEFYGVYINVEHIDEVFVKSRFGNNNGNLYKCSYGADLAYSDDNPDSYKIENSSGRIYELKINKFADDYTDLRDFIKILEEADNSSLRCALDTIFNVQQYLKIMAVDIFVGHWDGYLYNKNNYYLYHNNVTGKIEFIPYDVDNTFGVDWSGVSWAERNLYNWSQGGGESRKLYERLMEVDKFRNQFSFYMDKLINEVATSEILFEKIDIIKDGIRPFVELDPYYALDYGFTLQDFDDSYTEALGEHVKYGLKPYISQRIASAEAQLEEYSMNPIVNYVQNNHPRLYEELVIKAFVEDSESGNVFAEVFVDGDFYADVMMYDDGVHNDGEAGDLFYGCSLEPFLTVTNIEYQIYSSSAPSQKYPCKPIKVSIAEDDSPELYINEFMASNSEYITDEYGEYDDWFEIFNGDDHAIWLGDKYASDHFDNPDKFKLPDFMLESGSHVVIWADEDGGDQGEFHASFKLKKSGEQIALFDRESLEFPVIDSYIYSEQTTDISFGRLPDGGSNWSFMDIITPGSRNTAEGIPENIADNSFVVYPNPASGGFVYFNEYQDVTLYSSIGQLLLKVENTRKIDVSQLSSGLYIIINAEGRRSKLIVR
ncbi:MAG: CotH kinase family protein, partial [Bacteroidota bacterium]|nr:CotH kinase family protein [Bacteroidota bacterium]